MKMSVGLAGLGLAFFSSSFCQLFFCHCLAETFALPAGSAVFYVLSDSHKAQFQNLFPYEPTNVSQECGGWRGRVELDAAGLSAKRPRPSPQRGNQAT